MILRPFVDADTPTLLAALGDPDVRILTGSVHDEASARKPASPEEEMLAGEWYATRNDTDDRLDLAVVDRANESLRYGDQWIDATVMSILAPEWPSTEAS